MKKLPTGTRVRAVRDLDLLGVQDHAGRAWHVGAGEVGRIVAVGPDAVFGWYGVAFDEDRQALLAVGPVAPDAHVEVVELR